MKANKSRGGYSKAMPSDLRLAREAREAAEADPTVEAKRREERMLASLVGAREDFEWIAARKGWTLLGFDTCFDWWSAHVRPVADGLGLRPEPEFAKRVIALVEQEQAALPTTQRSSKKELAELVGASEWAARGRKETRQRRTAAGSDLDSAPPVIDSTFTEDTALSRLSDALAANGPTDDLDTEAGRANCKVILDAVEAAMADGGTEEAYSAHFGAVEDALRRAGFTAEQIDQAIGKYRPDAVSVPISVPVVEGLRAAIEATAASIGAGVTMPPARPAESPCSDAPDRAHCAAAGCGADLSGNEQTAGHLRCRSCDPLTLHKANGIGVEEGYGECDECAIQARIADRTSAAVTAGNTEDASPALGEPDVDELAASTSGTPSSEENFSDGEDAQPRVDAPVGSEPGYDGLGSGDPQTSAGPEVEVSPSPAGGSHGAGNAVRPGVPAAPTVGTPVPDGDGFRDVAVRDNPEERTEEEAASLTSEDSPADVLACPECAFILVVPAVDVDAGISEMGYHLDRAHGLTDADLADAWTRVRARMISPAADFIEPSHAGVPAVGGQDSPTGREGGRSELDHHREQGVAGGAAPATGIAVEPVLEDGGEMPPELPSSSDSDHWAIDDGWSAVYDAFDGSDRRHLIVFFDNIDALCDRLDVDVVGPLLTEEEMVHIHKAGDRLAQVAELLEHWRTK